MRTVPSAEPSGGSDTSIVVALPSGPGSSARTSRSPIRARAGERSTLRPSPLSSAPTRTT